LVAHNASFDFGFLNRELAICSREPICLSRMIDTVGLARVRHPGAKLSLDALCTRYGIDRSHRVKHGALLDAELLAHLYIELTGGRQIGLGLASEMPQSGDVVAASGQAQRPFREPRPHSASPAELERHRLFVASIPDAIWPDAILNGHASQN
jgi:DNA polymerase-3 subunit epsilon